MAITNTKTKNLGQIAAIWISSNAPTNQRLIWYDTAERIHKVYDTYLGEWVSINPQVVTSTDIVSLKNIAVNSGLSHGKFFYLTDIGTLAIAITTTKIWYVDSQNNYVVNDLAATITAYINSNNLLIDGSTGVWNNNTGKLEFSFTTLESDLDKDNDYFVIRRYYDSTWNWVKTKLKNIISNSLNNAITWNHGIYFNFKLALYNSINKSGGVLGYETYLHNQAIVNNAIENLSGANQEILDESKEYTDTKTSADALLNKQIGRSITIYPNPPEIPGTGSTIANIYDIIFSWIKVLQDSNRIKIGSGFSISGRKGSVNYSDTVRSAIEKLVYKQNNQSSANGIYLPLNFNINGRAGEYSASEMLNVLLEKMIYQIKFVVCDIRKYMTDGAILPQSKIYVYGIYPLECKATRIGNDEIPTLVFGNYSNQREEFFPHPTMIHVYTMLEESNDYTYSATYNWDEASDFYQELFNPTPHMPSDYYIGDYDAVLPNPDESIFKSIGKLAKIVSSIDNFKLPNSFNPNSYSGVPAAVDTLTTAIGKLSNAIKNFDKNVWESPFLNKNWDSVTNVGDTIGEFDSDGKPLYSASLEGAIYLLSSWYKKHFSHVSNAWTTIEAFFTYGDVEELSELSKFCQYRIGENTLSIRCQSATSVVTYNNNVANPNHNILSDNNIYDVTLVFKNLPQWVVNTLIDRYGLNNPFNINIPLIVKAPPAANYPTFIAHGSMYAVVVSAPQDSSSSGYLKLIPYITDVESFKASTNEGEFVLQQQVINENGQFGTDWLFNYSLWQICLGKISPFTIDIPLY